METENENVGVEVTDERLAIWNSALRNFTLALPKVVYHYVIPEEYYTRPDIVALINWRKLAKGKAVRTVRGKKAEKRETAKTEEKQQVPPSPVISPLVPMPLEPAIPDRAIAQVGGMGKRPFVVKREWVNGLCWLYFNAIPARGTRFWLRNHQYWFVPAKKGWCGHQELKAKTVNNPF